MEKTVVELFAGVGGFRCGFNHVTFENGEVNEEDRWDFIWANQWEPSTKSQAAFDCYIERFGKSSCHLNQDIATINKSDIPDHSVLVGGFPCQDYSVSQVKFRNCGIKGKKGVLWWQIDEIIEKKRPPFVLLENVDRLLRSPANQRGRDFGIMLRTLFENGYSVEWRVINAAEYGFPQKRRRTFIFAYHESTKYYKKMNNIDYTTVIYKEGIFAKNFPIIFNQNTDEFNEISIKEDNYKDIAEVSDYFDFHFYNAGLMHKGQVYTYKTIPVQTQEIVTLGDIIQRDQVDNKYFIQNEKYDRWKYLKGKKKELRTGRDGNSYYYSERQVSFPDKLNVPARTITTKEGTLRRTSHVIQDVYSGKLRTLTPIEAERIQMFPDNWTNIKSKSMSERRRFFTMGNALVVGIAQRLGDYISLIIDEE